MQSKIATLFAAAAVLPSAFAHYNFESLIVNGQGTEPYQYVRRTTNANSPIEDVTSPDIICNAGGIDADIMAATDTMTVQAGDQLGFFVNNDLGHPGPQAVYMSKAPGSAQEYTGDGDWFKIYELTYSDITDEGIQWATFQNNVGINNFTFTLPEDLPAGEYLLRAEHVGLHAAGTIGGAQFYIGCAQINVESSGTGTPGPTVQFPGAYDGTEPGLHIGIYYPPPQEYIMFGPATWPNACSDHTPNYDGQASDGDCTGDDGAAPAPVPNPPTDGGNSTTPVPSPAPPAGGEEEDDTEEETTLPEESEIPAPPTTTQPPVAQPTTLEPTPIEDGEEVDCPVRRRRALRAARKARKARAAERAARKMRM